MRDSITVIGSLNYDIILKSHRLPDEGETMPVESASFSCGGKGANQAVQASKLGIRTYMVGCVGNDAQGDALILSAQKYGLNTDYLRRTDGTTGMGIVYALDDGSVHSGIVRGANFELTKADIDAAEPVLRRSEIVVLQMEIDPGVNRYAIKKSRECGARVLINAAPAMDFPNEYLKLCDIIVVNEVEAAFYLGSDIDTEEKAGNGARELAERYGADVVITLGKAGSVVSDNGTITFIPSMKVEAIETTGAGDSFIGGVGYALMKGMSLTEACRFATCCSAVTVCRLGAQDSMPGLDEVMGIYKGAAEKTA